MVADNTVENSIQKSLGMITSRLVMESLAEEAIASFRIEKYTEYIVTNDPETRKNIIRDLYDKTVELGVFTVDFDRFEYAFQSDMRAYQAQQNKLESKASAQE
jgi:hypothetical protein